MRNGNDDRRATNRPEFTSTRRSLLKASSAGFLGTAAFGGGAGVTAAQSTGDEDGPLRLEIEQGERTYEVEPVATGETVETVYDRLGDSTSAGASTLAFVDGPSGPSLVVRNDDGDAEAGGELSYSFDELPAEGSWVVRDPDGSERVWPSDADVGPTCGSISGQVPTTGEGASTHFGWGGCGSWKEYDVEPGRTYRVRAFTDGCFTCVLYDATHELREPTDDGGWETTFEWDDPLGKDASTEYAYTPESDVFRVHNLDGNSGQGFYVHVYDTSSDATYETTEAAWSWTEGRTTGGAFRGDLVGAGDVEVTVDLDGASGVEAWELLDGSDAIELDADEPVTVRATRGASSTARALAEEFAPNFRFDAFQPWFPTDFEPYVDEVDEDWLEEMRDQFDDPALEQVEQEFEEWRRTHDLEEHPYRVVNGHEALNQYTRDYKDSGHPPRRTVYYNVVGVSDPDAPLAENDLIDVQYWIYYAFDQFLVNYHWHDMENVHVFVDTEEMEPILYVGSAHADLPPDNEFLDADGVVDRPATFLPELGSHSSATDVNAARGSFERGLGGTVAANGDVTNGDGVGELQEELDRLRYGEFDEPGDVLKGQLPAYGLPRDEHAPLYPIDHQFRMPKLDGDPVYEHETLDHVEPEDLIGGYNDELPGPVGLPPLARVDGVQFAYDGDEEAQPYDYELKPMDRYETDPTADHYVHDASERLGVHRFWGAQLTFVGNEPDGITDFLEDYTRTVGRGWRGDAYDEPTEAVGFLPHREYLQDEYDLDLLTPIETQVLTQLYELADLTGSYVEGAYETGAGFLDGVEEFARNEGKEELLDAAEGLGDQYDALRSSATEYLPEEFETFDDRTKEVVDIVRDAPDLDADEVTDELGGVWESGRDIARQRSARYREEYESYRDSAGETAGDAAEYADDFGDDPVGTVQDTKDEVVGYFSSPTTHVVPTSNGLLSAEGLEPGDHRVVIANPDMAPYVEYFQLEEGETEAIGASGALPLVDEDDAVRVTGEGAGTDLASVRVTEDTAGDVYDSLTGPDDDFVVYLHRDLRYTVEVTDEHGETGKVRVTPGGDDEPIRLDAIETGPGADLAHLVQFLEDTASLADDALGSEDGAGNGGRDRAGAPDSRSVVAKIDAARRAAERAESFAERDRSEQTLTHLDRVEQSLDRAARHLDTVGGRFSGGSAAIVETRLGIARDHLADARASWT